MALTPGGNQQKTAATISRATRRGTSNRHIWMLLLSGASASLAIQVAGAGLALATDIILARLIPLREYGIYAYVITWVNLLCVPALVGMGTAAVKYVAVYRTKNDVVLLGTFIHWGRRLVLAASLCIALLGAALVYFLPLDLNSGERIAFCVGIGLIPLITQIQFLEAVFRGIKRIALAGLFTFVVRPALLLAAIAISTYAFQITLKPLTVIMLMFAAAAVALIMVQSRLSPAGLLTNRSHPRYEVRREWLATAWPLLLTGLLSVSMQRVDILMLGTLKGVSAVGLYAAACKVAVLVSFGLNGLNIIVAPLIAENYQRGDMQALRKTIRFATYMSSGAALLVTIGLVVLGPTILGWFGDEFLAAYTALVILLCGQLVNACMGPVGLLLTMTRHQRDVAYVFGVAAILNVILNAFLIPRFGMLGAAIATAITTIGWNVACLMVTMLRFETKRFESS